MIIRYVFLFMLTLCSVGFPMTTKAKALSPNVGMTQVSAPISGGATVAVTLWYPSVSASHSQSLGPYQLDVAMAGEPVAKRHPLIIMSHGTGGSALSEVNLAISLAKAGFVVAAVEHTGDNYRDRSQSFSQNNLAARSHQISAAVDYLLKDWRHNGIIDAARIGMFGHSAGGTTALVIGGGTLDWGNVVQFCMTQPEDWGCKQGRQQVPMRSLPDQDATQIKAADTRIRALVIAAPAMTHGFAPAGLKKLKPPVQLWVAGMDKVVTNAGQVTRLLAVKPELHEVANAGHFSFLPACSYGLRAAAVEICSDQPGFDREAFQREFTSAIIRFFRTRLRH